MKAKPVLILAIAAVFIFLSTGISMAKDWKGGHSYAGNGHAYGHYKADKHYKVVPHKHRVPKRVVVNHHHYYQPRPVVVQKHFHQYNSYEPYPYRVGSFVAFSILNPDVAFSVAIGGH